MHTLYRHRPTIFRRRSSIWLFFIIGSIGFVGCENTRARPAFASVSTAPSSRPVYSPTEQAVATAAMREWHRTSADKRNRYELDQYNRRIDRRLRNAVIDLFPTLPVEVDRDDASLFTVAIDHVDLPQGNYAYVVLRVGSRFETAEHAYVYEYRDTKWVLLDHYLIANTLMEAVLTDFSWDAYCREHHIVQPEKPAAR